MKIKATVIDSESREPLEGANVVVIDKSGKVLGGKVASNAGYFEIDNSLLDVSGNKLQVSASGYDTMDLPPASIGDEIEMYRNYGSLDTFVKTFVKVKKNVQKSKNTVPIVLGSIAILILSLAIKKKVFK